MLRRLFILLVFIGLMPWAAPAEIEKIASPGTQDITFNWWPKVAAPEGWVQDKDASFHYGFNALVPAKSTFADAPTVMYAKASYKPQDPATTSIDQFIEKDKKDFTENVPDVQILPAGSIKTADGKTLTSYYFTPKTQGNWERVTYGEEGDFFLTFAISARTQDELKASEGAYEALVGGYKE